MNAHTPVQCPFCDNMPRKDRYATHLMTKHASDIGREMIKDWVENKPGCLLNKINQGITSLVQLQYIPSNNENISIIFGPDAKCFDSENDADIDKKLKLFKDNNATDIHYKFLTETCFKELNGFEVYQGLWNKVNNTLETAQLKKQLRELKKQLEEKPDNVYEELKKSNDLLEYENKKLKTKMSDEYNAMYETKYNECHYELTKAQREVQYHKNEIENLHKKFSEALERKSNVGMDEALMRDIAEWEKKKKKESGVVEKLEKDIRTLKEDIKKKDDEYKINIKKYKKNNEKYKKQILKLMASRLDDSDDESDTTDNKTISSIGS
jgi:hypothetical protein